METKIKCMLNMLYWVVEEVLRLLQMKKGEVWLRRGRKMIGACKDVTRDKNAKVGKNGRERRRMGSTGKVLSP